MKKLLLLGLMLNFAPTSFALLNSAINLMSPMDRHALSLSMIESADAYQAAKNAKKAKEFYRTALEIYPIGDQAHIIAQKLGIVLDDEETFQKFLLSGDNAFKNKNYNIALSMYLMALELNQHLDLYKKIYQAYYVLGDTENASFYQSMLSNIQQDDVNDEGDIELAYLEV